MLQIIFPMAFVTCSINMDVDAESIGLVVDPVAFVDISVDVDELTLPVCSIILPETFVACAIRPHLFTKAVSEAANPLSEEGGPRSKSVKFSILPLCIRIVNSIRNRFFLLFHGEVTTVGSFYLANQSHLLSSRVPPPQRLQLGNDSHVSPELFQIWHLVSI